MTSEHKIKKIFSQEGKLWMKAKKGDILSEEFLTSLEMIAPAPALPKKRPWNPVTVLAMALLLTVGVIAALPSLLTDTPPVQGNTPPSTDNGITPPDIGVKPPDIDPLDRPPSPPTEPEPPLWPLLATEPFVIVKLNEFTGEEIELFQGYIQTHFVRVNCTLLFANDGAPDHLSSIYVTENALEELRAYGTVMIRLAEMNWNDVKYYGPTVHEEGLCSEYLPLVDGRLVVSPEDLETASFESLHLLNSQIESNVQGSTSEITQAMPKETFENGMTVEQVQRWFAAWQKAYQLWEVEWRRLRNSGIAT